MKLQGLPKITKRKKKIVGRGMGSGKGGHTIGKGTKGQKSRTGYKPPMKGFEGGQNPLFRRLPKLKGFSRGRFKKESLILDVGDLNDLDDGTVLTYDILAESGIIKKSKATRVKVLGVGEINKKIEIKGLSVSKTAKDKIENAGGKVIE